MSGITTMVGNHSSNTKQGSLLEIENAISKTSSPRKVVELLQLFEIPSPTWSVFLRHLNKEHRSFHIHYSLHKVNLWYEVNYISSCCLSFYLCFGYRNTWTSCDPVSHFFIMNLDIFGDTKMCSFYFYFFHLLAQRQSKTDADIRCLPCLSLSTCALGCSVKKSRKFFTV